MENGGSSSGRRSTRSSTGGKDANKRGSEPGNGSEAGKQNGAGKNNGAVLPADEPTIGHIKRDEEDHHAVSVIVSLDDSFTLRQDMCLNCGSFGHTCDTSAENRDR